jgi:hypothetical protein
MKNQRLVTTLTLINLGIFIFLSFDRLGTVEARELLATCFEGVRSKLSMPKERCGHRSMSLPKGPARRADGSLVDQSGKIYPEAVGCLIRPDGRPR